MPNDVNTTRIPEHELLDIALKMKADAVLAKPVSHDTFSAVVGTVLAVNGQVAKGGLL